MSDFVQKVEKYIDDRKERERAEQEKVNTIQEKKAKIRATIVEVMSSLFNNSTLETNYKDLLHYTKDTDSYYIKIDSISFVVHSAAIESKIESNPKQDLVKIVETEILTQLENSDLPF